MMGEACYFRQRPGWPLEGVTFEQRADWSKEASNTQVKEQRFWCIWKQARPVQYPPYTWKEGALPLASASENLSQTHTHVNGRHTGASITQKLALVLVTAQSIILNSCPHDSLSRFQTIGSPYLLPCVLKTEGSYLWLQRFEVCWAEMR